MTLLVKAFGEKTLHKNASFFATSLPTVYGKLPPPRILSLHVRLLHVPRRLPNVARVSNGGGALVEWTRRPPFPPFGFGIHLCRADCASILEAIVQPSDVRTDEHGIRVSQTVYDEDNHRTAFRERCRKERGEREEEENERICDWWRIWRWEKGKGRREKFERGGRANDFVDRIERA